jgi:hypothetical protein
MLIIHPGHAVCGIYALCIDNCIVYVGKSRDLPNRAKAHKINILHSNDTWYPLARDFHERGHVFTMEVLATPEYKDLDSTEIEYIQKLKPLFNQHGLGEAGYKPMEYEDAVNKLFLGYRPPMKSKLRESHKRTGLVKK